ncbi:c-type cytochrome [Candidatus Bipolaricaulota bacterium]
MSKLRRTNHEPQSGDHRQRLVSRHRYSAARGLCITRGAWGTGAFRSNGELIYFTSTRERGTAITYTSGPAPNRGMMGNGQRACASCHGPNGSGGVHIMGMMQTMTAKDIRWSALQNEFDADTFRLAVVKGQDPDGTQLNTDMQRWNIGNDDLADLIAYLKTLP